LDSLRWLCWRLWPRLHSCERFLQRKVSINVTKLVLLLNFITWITTTHSFSAVRTNTPHIAREVGPLHDTLSARQKWRQLYVILESDGAVVLRALRNQELGRFLSGQVQGILVKTPLLGFHFWVVVGTQSQLEPAHVIGGQFDFDRDCLASNVSPDDDSVGKLPAGDLEEGRF